MNDMVGKDRGFWYRGIDHAMGKLTDDEVREIRFRVRNGETQTAIGREYRVSSSFVSQLCRRTRRAYVED